MRSYHQIIKEDLKIRSEKFLSFDPDCVSIDKVVVDWPRSGTLYFNGNNPFSDKGNDNLYSKENIINVIEHNLKKTNSNIVDYIKNFAHQAGFLNVASFSFQAYLVEQLQKIANAPIDDRISDFIENSDGSITFVERFTIRNVCICEKVYDEKLKRDVDSFVTYEPEANRPIGMLVFSTSIQFENGKIKHEIKDNTIYLTDKKLGDKFIHSKDGVIKKRYTTPIPKVQEEIQKEVNKKINHAYPTWKKVLIGTAVGFGVALLATGIVTAIGLTGGLAAIPIAAGAIGAILGFKGGVALGVGIATIGVGLAALFSGTGALMGAAAQNSPKLLFKKKIKAEEEIIISTGKSEKEETKPVIKAEDVVMPVRKKRFSLPKISLLSRFFKKAQVKNDSVIRPAKEEIEYPNSPKSSAK